MEIVRFGPFKQAVDTKMSLIFILLVIFQLGSSFEVNYEPSHPSWNHISASSQRTLRVLAIHNPPFIHLNDETRGIDILIVQAMAEKLKLKIRMRTVRDADYNRSIKSIK